MLAAGEATAPFDPIESERMVKELIGETVNKAFDALRTEIKADVLQLNAKFETVKAALDLNDGQVKSVMSINLTLLTLSLLVLKQLPHKLKQIY